MGAITVRPVTADTWADFVRLFEARGAPHYCWCTVYRIASGQQLENTEKKAFMQALVDGGEDIGVLAYRDGAPVGWCSVAPRTSYARLARSRRMPRVTPPEVSTWSVLCFFVPRGRRGTGVSHALLRGAVAYAREQGAEVVEGYPFDSAGISATHRGHSRVFRAAGFTRDGRRWAKRLTEG